MAFLSWPSTKPRPQRLTETSLLAWGQKQWVAGLSQFSPRQHS